MARLYVLLFLVQIVLAVLALISCLSAEEGEIRALPRLIWVLIILFFPLLGSLAWYFAGRPRPVGQPGTPWGTGGGSTAPRGKTRPLAPDDDPEFLKSIGEQSPQDRELFEQWEQDLRRREDDLRKRNGGEPPREEERP